MANLIDSTYFIRDINIPDTETPDETSVLDEAIARYEPIYLKKVLGYELWKAVQAEIDADVYIVYADLIEGAEFSFEYNGHTINTKWEGLINSEKESPIANFIYYKYRKEVETINASIGEKRQKGENSTDASALKKMVDAWNGCVDMSGKQNRYYKKYTSFFLDNSNYEHISPDPSLFNFLLANIDDYPTWVFSPLWKENVFGI